MSAVDGTVWGGKDVGAIPTFWIGHKTKHTHTDNTMTPYELRFNIFQLAQAIVLEKYHCEKENNPDVEFPQFSYFEKYARNINTFVSRDTQ